MGREAISFFDQGGREFEGGEGGREEGEEGVEGESGRERVGMREV